MKINKIINKVKDGKGLRKFSGEIYHEKFENV